MPITITLPSSPGFIGPGYQINVHTTFPGPFDPSTDSWHITIRNTPEEGEVAIWDLTAPCTGQTQIIDLSKINWVVNATALEQGNPCVVQVALNTLGGPLDTPLFSPGWTFSPTTQITRVIQEEVGAVQGGLTTEQAAQLEGTAQTNVLAQLTDALLLTELTNGPSSGPLSVQLATVTFGVIVRLVTIPSELVPQTPDNAYWVKTLATVRVFRGNDLWIRAPIHTPTKIVAFEKEGALTVWVANVTLTQWLLNIHLIVDFLPGVTGQVFQMHFP